MKELRDCLRFSYFKNSLDYSYLRSCVIVSSIAEYNRRIQSNNPYGWTSQEKRTAGYSMDSK